MTSYHFTESHIFHVKNIFLSDAFFINEKGYRLRAQIWEPDFWASDLNTLTLLRWLSTYFISWYFIFLTVNWEYNNTHPIIVVYIKWATRKALFRKVVYKRFHVMFAIIIVV